MHHLFKLLSIVLLTFFVTTIWAQVEPEQDESTGSGYQRLASYIAKDIDRTVGSDTIDAHVVDAISLKYRTGVQDEAIARIPAEMTEALKIDTARTLPRLVAFLKTGSKDSFHTVKRIHDWITLNIAYDNDAFYDRANGSQEPMSVIQNARTTCGGFAKLFSLMCEHAGIESKYIGGISRRHVKSSGMEGHAWSAVRIGGVWYIVDSTADNRQTYEFGIFKGLSGYRDGALFMSPQAKLLSNAARNLDEQFVTVPKNDAAFMRLPLVSEGILREGIKLDFNGLKGDFVKVVKPIGDSNIGLVSDAWYPSDATGHIRVEHPAGVTVRVSFRDVNSNKKLSLSACVSYQAPVQVGSGTTASMKQRTSSLITITPPGPGLYEVFIQAARPAVKDSTYRQIYSFLIIAEEGKISSYRVAAFDADQVYPTQPMAHLGLPVSVLQPRQLTPVRSDPRWTSIDVDTAAGIEYYAWLADQTGAQIPSMVMISQIAPDKKRFYIKRPTQGDAIFTLAMRMVGDKSFTNNVLQAYLPNFVLPDNTERLDFATQPLGEAIINPLFWENGFTLRDIGFSDRDNLVTIAMDNRSNKELKGSLRGVDTKELPFHASVFVGEKGQPLVRFSRAVDKYAIAKLYTRRPDGSSTTCLSLVLPPAEKNKPTAMELLYPQGQLFKVPEPMHDKISCYQEMALGGAVFGLGIKIPAEYEAFIALYGHDGQQLKGDQLKGLYQISFPRPGERVYYFTKPVEQGLVAMLLARKKGDKDYRQLYHVGYGSEIVDKPTSEKLLFPVAAGQVSLIPICNALFTEKGLSLNSWKQEIGAATLTIKGPADAPINCLIRTPDNKKGPGMVNYSYAGGVWTFVFTIPEGHTESIIAKVYLKDSKGSLSQVLSMPLWNPTK